jgi:putative DNA primase/helicase
MGGRLAARRRRSVTSAASRVRQRLSAPLAANTEPMRLAEAFRRHCYELAGEPTLVRWARAWWTYDGVRFVEHDDEKLMRDVFGFLDVVVVERTNQETGETRRERVTARKRGVRELMDALLKVMPILDGGAPQWVYAQNNDPDALRLVPCKNGLLDLRERQVYPPTPRLFATQSLGAPWLLDAPEPVEWLRFLDSLWGDDRESIRALQQIFGYLISPDTAYQKLFAIVGPKRSGKSTIGRILKALVGEGSAINPTLGSLERPFGLAPLVGKSVAIIGDARLGGRADQATVVERLLSISGEDPISIDRKNRDAINVRLRTRVVLLSNELPRLYDTSGALASRFLILQTTKSYLGEEDHQLEGKLLAELPGILRWAVEGYHDLLESGRFVSPAASERAQADLEAISSPITVFLRDTCKTGPGLQIECATLYEKWASWCKENGREPGNAQVFGRDLRTAKPEIGQSNKRLLDGKRQRFYEGITYV